MSDDPHSQLLAALRGLRTAFARWQSLRRSLEPAIRSAASAAEAAPHLRQLAAVRDETVGLALDQRAEPAHRALVSVMDVQLERLAAWANAERGETDPAVAQATADAQEEIQLFLYHIGRLAAGAGPTSANPN